MHKIIILKYAFNYSTNGDTCGSEMELHNISQSCVAFQFIPPVIKLTTSVYIFVISAYNFKNYGSKTYYPCNEVEYNYICR